jgi:aspartate aminotransferase
MSISDKMKIFAVNSSWIRKMFEEGTRMKAKYGADKVFDFSIGNPDAPPPPQFDQILLEAARDTSPKIHDYTPNEGHLWVKEAIAKKISIEQEVAVTGTDMLMTYGAAGGLNIALKAILDPGDEVIVLAPYFVDYLHYIDNHGGKGKIVETDKEFNLDLKAIEAALNHKTKAIFINSPNNPCGQIYSESALAALGALLQQASEKFNRTIFILADEPYRKIVFDGHTVPSIFKAYRNSIIVTSYSKDLSLPGERIGHLTVHPEIEDKEQLIAALTLANRILGFINAPAIMQRVIGAYPDGSIDISIYAKRRESICAVLQEAGYEFAKPKGTFYIFPKSPLADEVKFVAMLQEEKILTVPGRGFGTPGYFRIAFCTPDEVIKKSLDGFKRARQRAL